MHVSRAFSIEISKTDIFVAITGWLADKGSRQLPFLAGLAVAAVATLLLCFGTALWVLVIARLLQGFAASAVYTAGLALIADTVDASQVGSWQVSPAQSVSVHSSQMCRIGFVLSGMNFGALIAPFLAGIVYAKAGYYAVFGMILGLIALDFILRGVMIEKRTARKWFAEDNWSSSTAVLDSESGSEISEDSTTTEVDSSSQVAGDEQNEIQSDSPTETSPLLKKSWDAKRSQSWFRRRFPRMAILLDSPRMRAAFFGCFTHTTLTACFDTILPLFVKRTFRWDSAGAGLIFLCITIPTVLGTFVGNLSDRFGPRKMALAGFVLTIPTLALMSLIQDDSIESKVGLCVLLSLIGKFRLPKLSFPIV